MRTGNSFTQMVRGQTLSLKDLTATPCKPIFTKSGILRDNKGPTVPLSCPHCGQDFLGESRRQIWCSKKCRQASIAEKNIAERLQRRNALFK